MAKKNIKRKETPSSLDVFQDEIEKYLTIGLTISNIHKLVIQNMKNPISYSGFYRYVKRKYPQKK